MASLSPFVIIFVALFSITYCDDKPNVGKCEFPHYVQDHKLENMKRIEGLIGKNVNSEENWHYTVGICADLKIDGADDDAGVVQQKMTSDGKPDTTDTKLHNTGSLRDTHIMAGRDWALLEYRSGEFYHSKCGSERKRTLIFLTCDASIDDNDAKMVHVEEDNQKDEACYYLFEMKHKAVCPQTSAGSVLSVGSILVIVFVCIVAVYLLVGFLYQRFILGSKGVEQIPNYEFWKDFGNLQADGCDFLCRSKGRQSSGFRGIGDDQLETTEEIRDDNLLPM